MPLPISEDEKTRLMYQIFSLFVQYGFDGISMDEVAKRVKVSKATLYKYFKSKEDIVRDMVNKMTAHLDEVQFTKDNGIDGVIESVSLVYFKAVLTAAYSSTKFLADLENKFPDIYADYIAALESVHKRFVTFHEYASKEGYCNQVSITLVGEQLKTMLPIVVNSDYLKNNNITLSAVITEYYKLFLYQLIRAEYIPIINQDNAYLLVDDLVDILKSSFLIN
jgi:predicted DNA-binding protein YlxM (UPF0122 family)